MNKNILTWLILGAIVTIILGGTLLLNKQNKTNDSLIKKETSSENVTQTNPSYIPFSNNEFNNNVSKKRILYFYANWCPICRPLDAELLQTNKIPEGVVVFRVNYNDSDTDEDEKGLARKYQITYQHTFVQVDEKGNQITKWSGGSIDELLSNIK